MAEIKLVRLKKRDDDSPVEPKPPQSEASSAATPEARSGVRKHGLKPPSTEPLPAVAAVKADLETVKRLKREKAEKAAAKAKAAKEGKKSTTPADKAGTDQPKSQKATTPPPAKKKKKIQPVLPPRLETLSDEQEEQLAKCRAKWQKAAVSTARINRDRVTQVIQDLYAYAGKPEPEVLFQEGPDLTVIQHFLKTQYFYTPSYILRKPCRAMNKAIRAQVGRSLRLRLHDYFMENSLSSFSDPMYEDLAEQLQRDPEEPIDKLEMSRYAYYDFALTLIDDPKVVAKEWKLLQAWAKEGQWSFMFENICVICDRPSKIDRPKKAPVQITFPNGAQF